MNNMATANGTNEKYLNGPDQVIPAEDYINCSPGGHVKLRLASRGLASEPPISVPSLLNRTVAKYPDNPALVYKKPDGAWQKINYRQYKESVRTVAKAFIKLGLERYHSVCILGFNSPEWFIADLAAIHAGGYAVGIYTTNSPEACEHCLQSSRADICAVQDKTQLEKILSIRANLKHLKAIIQWEGTVDKSEPGVYSWQQLLDMGAKEPETQLDHILKTMSVNECCTLVYTSGTVGLPKAVMLSHDNLTWNAQIVSQRVGDLRVGEERIVTFLPLSHVAAQTLDIYTLIFNAGALYFAQPDALKGTLVETLKEVRPTRFLAVPRLWEKMYEKIMAVGSQSGTLKRSLATWAKDKGLKYHIARINGQEGSGVCYKLARSLVFSRVKEALGLDQCMTFATAAAPLSPDIKNFFLSLDIPIVDAYGMSEAAGAHTFSIYPKFKLDCAGEFLSGTETKFGGSVSPNGPGEILMRGRHVCMGYLNDEAKTRDAIDTEGWLHSGDVGRADSLNLLYITGRIKELIITAGGENVAPVIIEQAILSELHHVGYAVLIGDKRKFLSVLLTLKCKVNTETGEALDELDNEVKKWLKSLGSEAIYLSEVVKTKDPVVHKAIEEGIARANKHAPSNAQKVHKFAILPADFSMPSGELGPTFKVRRNVVHEKYKDIVEGLYKD